MILTNSRKKSRPRTNQIQMHNHRLPPHCRPVKRRSTTRVERMILRRFAHTRHVRPTDRMVTDDGKTSKKGACCGR